jgi:hypothetical protein
MKKIQKNKLLPFYFLINLALFCSNANAYIDPSSMILGIQAIIAVIVSGVIWIGKPIDGIKKLIKKVWSRRA